MSTEIQRAEHMNVLVVYAHPNPRSFNAAMRDTAVDALTEAGHTVKVSDLYAMHFKATLDRHDFRERWDLSSFNPVCEQYHATATGTFSDDIKSEIERVQWADLMIFQFPLWGLSFPAILKGWFDRVFACGVAVRFATGDPLLSGKRATLAFTTGRSAADYSANGPIGDINELLAYVTRGIFDAAGLDVMPSFIAFGVHSISFEARCELLQRYRRHLLTVTTTQQHMQISTTLEAAKRNSPKTIFTSTRLRSLRGIRSRQMTDIEGS